MQNSNVGGHIVRPAIGWLRQIGPISIMLLTMDVFAEPVFPSIDTLAVPFTPSAVLVGDIDSDGSGDILVADESEADPDTDGLSRLLGDGTGQFSAPERLLLTASSTIGIRAAVFSDHSANGVLDLSLVSCVTALTTTCFTGGYLNDGTGNFSLISSNTISNRPSRIAVGNFLGGTTPAVATPFSNALSTSTILEGFVPAETIRTAANGTILDMAIGDIDQDGVDDIFLAVPSLEEVEIFYGFANFQFRRLTIAAGFAPRWFTADDFDGDGRVDLAATDEVSGRIGVFFGNTNGALEAPVFFGVGGIGSAIASADFDGDDDQDIAVAVAALDQVDILMNDGNGAFVVCAECAYSVGDEPRELAVGDLTDDGLPDLVTGNAGTPSVSILSTNASSATTTLVASVLPASRSVEIDSLASVFATVINVGSVAAEGCSIAPVGSFGPFHFQTTDAASNALTGNSDVPVTIAPQDRQSFLITLEPDRVLDAEEVELRFRCDNAADAPSIPGLNTWLLSSSTVPVADVIALSATTSQDGVVQVPAAGAAFSVAAVNVGTTDELEVVAQVNGGADVTVSLCETDPVTSACVNPITPSLSGTTLSIASGATPTFSVFLFANAPVPFDPANARVSVEFLDAGGVVRGSTSVAIQTPPD